MRTQKLAYLSTAVVLMLVLTGCSGSSYNKYDYEEPFTDDFQEAPEPDYQDYSQPSEEQYGSSSGGLEELLRSARESEETGLDRLFEERLPAPWTCRYDETWNYDWHDDVLCSNGVDRQRPYLLEWADFVTHEDMMAAAAEYESFLNSQ